MYGWPILKIVSIVSSFIHQLPFDQLFNFFAALLWQSISFAFLIYAK